MCFNQMSVSVRAVCVSTCTIILSIHVYISVLAFLFLCISAYLRVCVICSGCPLFLFQHLSFLHCHYYFFRLPCMYTFDPDPVHQGVYTPARLYAFFWRVRGGVGVRHTVKKRWWRSWKVYRLGWKFV